MAELNVSCVTSVRFFGLSRCSKTKPAACRPRRGRAKQPCHWEEEEEEQEEEEEEEEASDGLDGAREGSGPPIVGVWTINLGRLYRTEEAFAIPFLAKICLRLVFTRKLVPVNMFARISRGSNDL